MIPSFDSRYLTYDLPLVGLNKMCTFSTKLESTSQVFAYGHDLFLSRMRPDNKFDMIDEDFNYALLFLGIIGLFVANFMLSKYLKSEKSKKEFLIH